MKVLVTVVLSLFAISLVPAEASAAGWSGPGGFFQASGLRSISGASPLPSESQATEDGLSWCGTGEAERHWEQDNSLAVDPSNPSNMAAAWIQDWSDAIVVAYSGNGGATWTKSVPPTTPCTRGIQRFGTAPGTVSAIDPSVSFGADGTLYLSAVITTGTLGPSAVIVDRSLDGGKTWLPWSDASDLVDESSAPGALGITGPDPEGLDYSNVVADPRRPGVAFVTWYRLNFVTSRSTQYLSVTADGGDTWSEPSIVPSVGVPFGARLIVLGDGSLVSVGAEVPPQPGAVPGQVLAGKSVLTGPTTVVARTLADPTDPLALWSPPATIGVADPGRFVVPAANAAPDGKTLVASWSATDPTRDGFTLMFSRSVDGGTHWTMPAPAGPAVAGLPATGSNDVPMAPSVAATDDRSIAVAFYDHRRDGSGDEAQLATDVWLRYSNNGGATWQESHLAGPFDKAAAPQGQLADMNGMVSTPGGLAAIFSLSEPLEGADYSLDTQYSTTTDGSVVAVQNTDIYFTTLRSLPATGGLR